VTRVEQERLLLEANSVNTHLLKSRDDKARIFADTLPEK
jgi:hypothetical protein